MDLEADLSGLESSFAATVGGYYAKRQALGVSEAEIENAAAGYPHWGFECSGEDDDPEIVDLIERWRSLNTRFTSLHQAWLASTGRWPPHRSLDGVVGAEYLFSEEGRRFEIHGLATWFANSSARSENMGPVRGNFWLDFDPPRLLNYDIFFLDRRAPAGEPYSHDRRYKPPQSDEDWLFVFRAEPDSNEEEGDSEAGRYSAQGND